MRVDRIAIPRARRANRCTGDNNTVPCTMLPDDYHVRLQEKCGEKYLTSDDSKNNFITKLFPCEYHLSVSTVMNSPRFPTRLGRTSREHWSFEPTCTTNHPQGHLSNIAPDAQLPLFRPKHVHANSRVHHHHHGNRRNQNQICLIQPQPSH